MININETIATLKKLQASIKELEGFSDKPFLITDQLRTAKDEVQLPLNKRLRDTDEEALNRDAMEKATLGKVDETRINGIIEEYLKEKILRNFI